MSYDPVNEPTQKDLLQAYNERVKKQKTARNKRLLAEAKLTIESMRF